MRVLILGLLCILTSAAVKADCGSILHKLTEEKALATNARVVKGPTEIYCTLFWILLEKKAFSLEQTEEIKNLEAPANLAKLPDLTLNEHWKKTYGSAYYVALLTPQMIDLTYFRKFVDFAVAEKLKAKP